MKVTAFAPGSASNIACGFDCLGFAVDGPGDIVVAESRDQPGVEIVEITGDGQLDDPCAAEPGATGVDDCDAGYMCWNVDEEGMGTCFALCTGDVENPMCPGTVDLRS